MSELDNMTYRTLDALVEIQMKKLEEQDRQIKDIQKQQKSQDTRSKILAK